MAMSDCCQQVTWIQSLFSEIGIKESKTPICGDNQGSIFIANNPVQERWTKHIDIRFHYICEQIELNVIEALFIAGSDNPADMFMKALDRVKFHKFRQLGIEFVPK